ncbi:hypothetical protein KUV50_12980 [Membranicola marinus]|uniref:Uncharacterized protein n=1 Tax=Membranihabitans marinus TaxID=1227546 RepID=A0A953HWH7_9BACT|nr:hypothetical protein [Membranihabitans marinus]MBY5959058.1 hypothetical protein [Membranihabitans marinus]
MRIRGIVRYITLETGFWGIESEDGEKYIPVNMPEQLKNEGRQVEIEAETVGSMSGLQMWGQYVKVLSFET